MPKLKERVTLKCAQTPEVSAALTVLSDPGAHEDEWVNAASVIDRHRQPHENEPQTSTELGPAADTTPNARHKYKNKPWQRIAIAAYVALIGCLVTHVICLQIGQWEFDQQHYKTSLRWIKIACATNPFDAHAYLVRAKCLNRMGKFESAAKAAARAMLSNSTYSQALLERAWANIGRNKLELAKRNAEQLSKVNASEADAILGAVRFMEVDPDQSKMDVYEFNVANEPRFRQALTQMNLATANGCTRPELYKYRGMCEHRINFLPATAENQAALEDLTVAIELGATDYQTYKSRARVNGELYRDTAAVADMTKCLELDDKDSPPDSRAKDLLEIAKLSLHGCNLSDAIQIARLAIKENPNLWEAYDLRAKAEFASREYRPAIEDWQTALNKTSHSECSTRLAMAEAFAQLGDRANMEKQIQAAVALGATIEDCAAIRKILSSEETSESIHELAAFRKQIENQLLAALPPGIKVTPTESFEEVADNQLEATLSFEDGRMTGCTIGGAGPSTIASQSMWRKVNEIRMSSPRLPAGVTGSQTIHLYFLDESPLTGF